MAGCCSSPSYEQVFSSRQARWDAARYSRKGLGWAPGRTVELFKDRVIGGDSFLEIGGGIGDLQVELLRLGVARAVSIELSPSYEEKAAKLLRDAGLDSKAIRLIGDFVTLSHRVKEADLVVMHSVICCYPDMERLVEAAAAKTKRYLVVSYPRDTWWLRLFARAVNDIWYRRVRRSDFRFFIHPPPHIHRTALQAGLSLLREERNAIGHLAVFRSGEPK